MVVVVDVDSVSARASDGEEPNVVNSSPGVDCVSPASSELKGKICSITVTTDKVDEIYVYQGFSLVEARNTPQSLELVLYGIRMLA